MHVMQKQRIKERTWPAATKAAAAALALATLATGGIRFRRLARYRHRNQIQDRKDGEGKQTREGGKRGEEAPKLSSGGTTPRRPIPSSPRDTRRPSCPSRRRRPWAH